MLFSRQSDNRAWAELRAQLAQLLAENDRLKGDARLEARARADLVEAVRTLSNEVAAGRIDLRDLRHTFEWATDDL